jgi:hypothetical protein
MACLSTAGFARHARSLRVGATAGDRCVMLHSVPSKRELRETAEALRRILAAVERGDLTAPAGLAQRLEGAAAALEALGASETPRASSTAERPDA